jgi:hypothetical protein
VVGATIDTALQNQIIGHLVARPGLVPLVAAQVYFLAIRLAAITVVSRVVSILLSPFYANPRTCQVK